MEKFAKVIDEKTKRVSVGLGNNDYFYKSIGMKKLDVEQSYDGDWYLLGFAPKKPETLINKEKIDKLQEYLNSTDWYVTRFAETGVEIPEDVKEKRAEARKEIDRLRKLKDEEL